MKNLIKPMIVFGMILFLLGAMASCKEKNEEKEIEDLVEKMGEAKTEQEAAKIAEKIEKLEQRAKKSSKEIIVKLGQPFTFWQHGQGPSDPKKKSEFRMTFKEPLVDKFLPYEPKFMEVFRGQRTQLRRTPADQGKKYFGIVAKIENLGPRESSFKRHMELKVDRDYIYRLVSTGIVDDPKEDYPREIYTLEPGKTGWLRLWCQIPEDTYPVEVFGKLGEGYYAAPGYTSFRLKLTQFGKYTGEEGKEEVLDEYKGEDRKLSKEEIRLLGKYVGRSEEVFQMFMELKRDGTALINSSPIFGWEVIWEPKDNPPYSPTLTLLLYASNGSITYHASDGKQAIKIPLDFNSYQINYWHRRVMNSQEILVRQQEANLIKLSKVKVWDTDERAMCPGDVKICDRYINTEDQRTVLELKRIPNFTPPGWKRLTGCDGLCLFYSTVEWEFNGNEIKISSGGEKPIELEIKANTLIDRQNNITFVKQNDDFQFLIFAAELSKQGGMVKKEEIDQFGGEMIWVKCKNPNCGAEYQTSKKEYFKYIEEHANPMAPTAPPLVCEKCGEQSVYRAEKCGNVDCEIIFFRGTVPNDFPDRCPECGYSATEESRKQRRALVPKPEKENRVPKADLPRLNFAEAIPIVSVKPNPEAAKLITEAKAFINKKPARIIGARDRLNEALRMPMSAEQRTFVKDQLSELANTWLFGETVLPNDKLCESYKINSTDQIMKIGERFKLPYDILININKISQPQSLRAGEPIKVINGPFHAHVCSSTFTMDVYLQNTFVRSFPVGLGKPGHETPTGLWRVKSNGKLIKPPWPDPDTGKMYYAEDPEYPLGSRWIGLDGLEGNTKGRTGFGIHGTKHLSQIGTTGTQGCICLYDDDAILLYNLLVPAYSLVKVADQSEEEEMHVSDTKSSSSISGISSEPVSSEEDVVAVQREKSPKAELPSSTKQELIAALEDLERAIIKKIILEVDVTAQCFTSVKEYRRAKLLADVLRPVLRVLQGTLSVLSKISDTTTLSGQVKSSLGNAQYVSEAASLFFMVNGLRESGEKLYYAIDDTAGYVRTVKDMLQAADQTTVIRMDPRAYKQVIKQYLDSEQGTPLIIARTSELAPDKKPAKGALVLYKTIREEFRTLIEQIQRSELPQDFPLQDAVAEIEQLKHQIVEAGVHNIDVHYSIYHQGLKVHQSRKLGAVAEHNKAFAQVAGALAKRLDIEIYAECAQLAATGADAAYIVTYKVPGAGEAVKMTQQVSLLPQIVIEGKKMFTVDPEEQFYQMPQEMLFSLAIEFSSLLRIADDTVLSLTKLLEETSSQVPPSEVQPTPTSTKQKEPAKQIEKQVEETVKSLFKKLLRKKR